MRKVDAGWAILAGFVQFGLALFTPLSRVLRGTDSKTMAALASGDRDRIAATMAAFDALIQRVLGQPW